VVYLREFENNTFWIYGNYNSRKSKHIEANPNVSLNFFWPALEKQIRIEGTAVKCETKHSDEYFSHRPDDSKLGAWASNQSSELRSRQELEDAVEKYRKQFEGKEIPRPPHWGGWIITANYYEFWQGRKSRLHDRISYTQEKGKWVIRRLAP
jgi:pyridoxamine 5'-phosphate oxidase